MKGLFLTTSLVDGGRGRDHLATVFEVPLKRITMPVLLVVDLITDWIAGKPVPKDIGR